jgi:hypothetical protein
MTDASQDLALTYASGPRHNPRRRLSRPGERRVGVQRSVVGKRERGVRQQLENFVECARPVV